MDRKFDIVLLGATGFTGKLGAEYMTKNLPKGTRWAIAGRSSSKLGELSEALKIADVGGATVAVDMSSEADLLALARSTRVLINAVGPAHVTNGSGVVKACAESGTDYVDCLGEPPWRQEIVEQYHESAQSSGAKIILTCAAVGGPMDLCTYLVVDHLRRKYSLPTREVVGIWTQKGSVSGGSIGSTFSVTNTYSQARIAASSSLFALSPVKPSPSAQKGGVLPGLNVFGVQKVAGLEGALIPSIMGLVEDSLIGRSWGLYASDRDASSSYGPNFYFSSRMHVAGSLTGAFSSVATSALMGLITFSWVQSLVARIFPPGSGPTADQRGQHHFKVQALGVADTGQQPTRKAIAELEGGDGYEFTAMIMTEAALLLLEGGTEAHRRGGGIFTPAMLGEKLAERIQRPEAGAKIQVRDM